METTKITKLEKRMFFLVDKIICCKSNGMKPHYFCHQLKIGTNKWFKQKREEYKTQEK